MTIYGLFMSLGICDMLFIFVSLGICEMLFFICEFRNL